MSVVPSEVPLAPLLEQDQRRFFSLVRILLVESLSMASIHKRERQAHEMRKVVGYLLMSLDGVVEEPDDWMKDFDEEMQDNLVEVINAQDAVLLGRVMYQEWATVWPKADFAPAFKQFINTVHKYVISTTLNSADEWEPATLITHNVAQEIATLKQQPGKNIGVHGSITL